MLRGAQQPRVRSCAPYLDTAGGEAADLAARAGLLLDPWQAGALDDMLAERDDGKLASFESALIVPRQNGKGSVLEAYELHALYVAHDELVIHSAHEFKTAAEAFRRILSLIDGNDFLSRHVLRISKSNGEEGVELRSRPTVITGADGRSVTRGVKSRLRFFARTGGSGRGFSGDKIILDEAYHLPETVITALIPTMSTKQNPQIVYTSSPVDRDNPAHRNGEFLSALRRRALRGAADLCYLEYSVDADEYEADPEGVSADPQRWAQSNPGLGIRISEEYIAREARALNAPSRAFAVERLGVGYWFEDPEEVGGIIPADDWRACQNDEARFGKALRVLAVDVTPDRKVANIAACGASDAGVPHVQLLKQSPVSGGVAELLELWRRQRCPVVVDPGSPAGAYIADLEAAGCDVLKVSLTDIGQACGRLYDRVVEHKLTHLGQKPIDDGVRQAQAKPVSRDAWVWDLPEGGSVGTLSPLYAATFAFHGWVLRGARAPVLNVW